MLRRKVKCNFSRKQTVARTKIFLASIATLACPVDVIFSSSLEYQCTLVVNDFGGDATDMEDK